MPGELERLIMAILQPKSNGIQTQPAAMMVQYDAVAAVEDLGPTLDLTSSNLWDTAIWGGCSWT